MLTLAYRSIGLMCNAPKIPIARSPMTIRADVGSPSARARTWSALPRYVQCNELRLRALCNVTNARNRNSIFFSLMSHRSHRSSCSPSCQTDVLCMLIECPYLQDMGTLFTYITHRIGNLACKNCDVSSSCRPSCQSDLCCVCCRSCPSSRSPRRPRPLYLQALVSFACFAWIDSCSCLLFFCHS